MRRERPTYESYARFRLDDLGRPSQMMETPVSRDAKIEADEAIYLIRIELVRRVHPRR